VERIYRTIEDAELDLVRWIDGWYNLRRIQRELGWLSPDEYEEAYYRRQAPASRLYLLQPGNQPSEISGVPHCHLQTRFTTSGHTSLNTPLPTELGQPGLVQ